MSTQQTHRRRVLDDAVEDDDEHARKKWLVRGERRESGR